MKFEDGRYAPRLFESGTSTSDMVFAAACVDDTYLGAGAVYLQDQPGQLLECSTGPIGDGTYVYVPLPPDCDTGKQLSLVTYSWTRNAYTQAAHVEGRCFASRHQNHSCASHTVDLTKRFIVAQPTVARPAGVCHFARLAQDAQRLATLELDETVDMGCRC